MEKDLIFITGSASDSDNAKKVTKIWDDININYRCNIASCHKHGGGDFAKFILNIQEKLIVFMGGMSLAAPGLIEVLNKKAKKYDTIVFGIPTDKAAMSAIQDLPKGTAIITSGLNQVSLTHSLINSALATSRLAGMISNDLDTKKRIATGQRKWYQKNWDENPMEINILF